MIQMFPQVKKFSNFRRRNNRNWFKKAIKISQTAKITVEVINVKFFSAQLDNKFVEKWTTLLEKSDTETILREVIKPKTHEENVNFTQQIKTQENW